LCIMLKGAQTVASAAARPVAVPATARRLYSGLGKVLKVEELQDKDKDEIEQIWLEFHKNLPYISAVVPPKFWEDLDQTSTKYPSFVFPIPRDQGFETFYMQRQDNHFLWTSLESFKKYGPAASPLLNVAFFDELKESKRIVLMRGEVPNQALLHLDQARYLTNQLTLFYTTPERFKLVKTFHKRPEQFSFDELLKLSGKF